MPILVASAYATAHTLGPYSSGGQTDGETRKERIGNQ